MHGDGAYRYRNSDLGNAVQQAEIVKCVRLVCGVDDLLSTDAYALVPRLPENMMHMTVQDYPVTLPDRRTIRIAYVYGRGEGSVTVRMGDTAYYLCMNADVLPRSVRFVPFPLEGDATVPVSIYACRHFIV